MFSLRKSYFQADASLKRACSLFRRDLGAAATIEFVLLAPVILSMLALIVAGGEGFEVNRKVTMVVRTLADLASQQQNLKSTSVTVSGTTIPAGTYTATQILSAASLVIAPYDSTQLSLVLSEVSANGSGSGTVVWSQANGNGTALSVGSSVTVPSNITTSGYLILGAASYNFAPLQIFLPMAAFPITDSLYLAPRTGTIGVQCCS